MMAAGYGAEGSVDLLLARGADKRLRNDRDMDAVGFAKLGGQGVPAGSIGVNPALNSRGEALPDPPK